MNNLKRYPVLLSALLSLAACSVGPEGKAPQVAPIEYVSPQVREFANTAIQPDAAWWTFFDDAQLEQLIATAVAHNRDVRQARASLLLARANFDEQALQRLPVVTSELTYQRSIEQREAPDTRPQRSLSESWRAGLDVQWELDLFGRLDHLSSAAQSRVEASQADVEQVQLSIAAEVAQTYFAAQGLRQQLLLANDEVRSWGETVRMVEAQMLLGSGLPEDRESAQSKLLLAQAAIAPLQGRLQRNLYRLQVLSGQRPGSAPVPLEDAPPLPLARQMPLGDPNALILNRPDVIRAQRLLAARVEEVGAATADFYPRLSLGGFIGFFALRNADVGSASRAFELTPGVTWPAFDLGSVRARLRAAQALSEAETERFEQVLLLAIEEVEGAIVQLTEHQRHLQTLVRSARHAEVSFDIASRRYDSGSGSYQAVLESQRELLRMRQDISQAETASYRNVVDLYKALAWRTPATSTQLQQAMASQ
ncbi:TolC family protein [Pseudomonas auratipiscis]|uniref:TolC family protein n=1 Tax=Pseudomonas auratipiscis TaxID=3115853 RepID=A0AB35WTQ1_9PSED|nr:MULTISPECIES: TolC family protein [unclassified Pseudomonas]MEE1867570.1 TolC family protein [Pseudomonas sp. 120P]MEE1958397.1 TolC family protein [Pseudomonas sp. 119P]